MLELSILDVTDALHAIELAPLAERMGYCRYWLAEHHDALNVHNSCPEIVTAIVAGLTERMRVGTAAILLPYYSPRKVAETFLLLSHLYPDRVDAGIARGRGTSDAAVSDALLDGRAWHGGDDFEPRVRDVIALLERARTPPPVWIVGGLQSAAIAARLGASFCFGMQLGASVAQARDAIRVYRDEFRPGRPLAEPRWNVCVGMVCAETAQAAAALVPDGAMGPPITGNPSQCAERLDEIAHLTGAREIVVANQWGELDARVASFGLLAEAVIARAGRHVDGE